MVDVAAQVDLRAEEVRADTVDVGRRGRVLHDQQVVDLRPLGVRLRVQGLLVQLVDQPVRIREVRIGVVVVVRLRDALPVEEHVEPVARVRVVLVPVGVHDLRLVRLVADRREVDAVVEDLQLGLVAELGQHRSDVVHHRLRGRRVVAPDGDRLPLRARLVHELLRLREVVGIGADLLVLRVGRREEVLGRLGEPAEELHHRLPVDRVVDRLAHLDVVERRDPVVHGDVERVRRGVELELVLVLRLDLVQAVRGEREHVVVRLSAENRLQGGRQVGDDLAGDLVGVPSRDVRDALELRVPNEVEAAVRLVARDHVGPRRGDPLGRLVARRRPRRHEGSELGRQDVQEVAARLRQLDRDRARLVVRHDAADVTRLRVRREGVGALDHREEPDARRVDLVVALDRVLEVARLDGRAVRVLEIRPQRELVRLPVRRDVRHVLGEIRHERGAVRPGNVLVPHQAEVDVPHDLPARDGVREGGVEVVRCVPGDVEDGERLAGGRRGRAARRRRSARGLVASSATAGRDEGDPGHERADACEPRPLSPYFH